MIQRKGLDSLNNPLRFILIKPITKTTAQSENYKTIGLDYLFEI